MSSDEFSSNSEATDSESDSLHNARVWYPVDTGTICACRQLRHISRSLDSQDFKGLTENDGHENDRPSKLRHMKLQDMYLRDIKTQCMK